MGNRKILITGSSGHLGEALMRTIPLIGHEAIGIDIKPGAFTTIVGSITDAATVDRAMKDVSAVLHTATLHKPHVATHSRQDFIDVNITGTLNLLEAAVREKVESFVYTSTTSTFGDMLTPAANEPAIWITEDIRPVPKNIYGVTKLAAEDLCQLFFRNQKLPGIVLKTSRFFPEEDDNRKVRETFADANIKVNELLYRRVDVEDVVAAHILAMEKATEIGFAKYIISASSPFTKSDLTTLRADAASVVKKLFPSYESIYQSLNWKMLSSFDRVYVNDKARNELGWKPKYDFAFALEAISNGRDFRSELTSLIGKKGYHEMSFDNEPFPVEE